MLKENKLTLHQKIFYDAGELSGCLSNTIIGFFYLYYLTDIVKLKPALAGMAILIGSGLAAAHVMPHTIIPDSVDYGEYLTGERQEGLYFGFLTFIQKVGTAGAIGASGIILQFAGYSADAVQSQTVLWTIRILLGPVPGLFLLIGIICIYFYPIDKKCIEKFIIKLKACVCNACFLHIIYYLL